MCSVYSVVRNIKAVHKRNGPGSTNDNPNVRAACLADRRKAGLFTGAHRAPGIAHQVRPDRAAAGAACAAGPHSSTITLTFGSGAWAGTAI